VFYVEFLVIRRPRSGLATRRLTSADFSQRPTAAIAPTPVYIPFSRGGAVTWRWPVTWRWLIRVLHSGLARQGQGTLLLVARGAPAAPSTRQICCSTHKPVALIAGTASALLTLGSMPNA